MLERKGRWLPAAFLFLLVLTLSLASAPGRIDTIDAQWRFEMSNSLYETGRPVIRDPTLIQGAGGLGRLQPNAQGDYFVASYGLGGALLGLPLVAIADHLYPGSTDARLFFFSLTNSLAHALATVFLFLLLRLILKDERRSLAGGLLYGVASLSFYYATTGFDQLSRELFLVLAVFLGVRARISGRWLDALLVGVAAGVPVHFNEGYILFAVAFVFLVVDVTLVLRYLREGLLPSGSVGQLLVPVVAYAIGLSVMLAALVLSNLWQFGVPLAGKLGGSVGAKIDTVTQGLGVSQFGVALAGLFVSPGKGLLFFSPLAALGLLGMFKLHRVQASVSAALVCSVPLYVLLLSGQNYWGGDWCWGPRYLVPIEFFFFIGLSLWPGMTVRNLFALLLLGFLPQALGLAIDMHRYYINHLLGADFWNHLLYFHFEYSILSERWAEIEESIANWPFIEEGMNRGRFRPGPYQGLLSYAAFLPAGDSILRYPVYWSPRPWLMWSALLPGDLPLHLSQMRTVIAGLAGTTLLAGVLLPFVKQQIPPSGSVPTGRDSPQ